MNTSLNTSCFTTLAQFTVSQAALQTALYLAAPKSSQQLGVLPIRSHLKVVYFRNPLSSLHPLKAVLYWPMLYLEPPKIRVGETQHGCPLYILFYHWQFYILSAGSTALPSMLYDLYCRLWTVEPSRLSSLYCELWNPLEETPLLSLRENVWTESEGIWERFQLCLFLDSCLSDNSSSCNLQGELGEECRIWGAAMVVFLWQLTC